MPGSAPGASVVSNRGARVPTPILFHIDLVLDQGQSLAGKHLRPNASSIFYLAPNAASDVDRYRPSACER